MPFVNGVATAAKIVPAITEQSSIKSSADEAPSSGSATTAAMATHAASISSRNLKSHCALSPRSKNGGFWPLHCPQQRSWASHAPKKRPSIPCCTQPGAPTEQPLGHGGSRGCATNEEDAANDKIRIRAADRETRKERTLLHRSPPYPVATSLDVSSIRTTRSNCQRLRQLSGRAFCIRPHKNPERVGFLHFPHVAPVRERSKR